jgi:hypothetical protein
MIWVFLIHRLTQISTDFFVNKGGVADDKQRAKNRPSEIQRHADFR